MTCKGYRYQPFLYAYNYPTHATKSLRNTANTSVFKAPEPGHAAAGRIEVFAPGRWECLPSYRQLSDPQNSCLAPPNGGFT